MSILGITMTGTNRAQRAKRYRARRQQSFLNERRRQTTNRGGNNRGGNSRGSNRGGNSPRNEGPPYTQQSQAPLQFNPPERRLNEETERLNTVTGETREVEGLTEILRRREAESAAYYEAMVQAEVLRSPETLDLLKEIFESLVEIRNELREGFDDMRKRFDEMSELYVRQVLPRSSNCSLPSRP